MVILKAGTIWRDKEKAEGVKFHVCTSVICLALLSLCADGVG